MKKLSLVSLSDEEKFFYPDGKEDPNPFTVVYKQLSGEEFLATRLRIASGMNPKAEEFFNFRNEILKAKIVRFENLELTKDGQPFVGDCATTIDLLASAPACQILLDSIFATLYSSSSVSDEEKNG